MDDPLHVTEFMSDFVDEMFDKYLSNATFLTGLGCGLSIGLLCVVIRASRKKSSDKYSDESKEKLDKSESNESITTTQVLEQVLADGDGDYKLVLVVRNDLKMGKGKAAVQCGHASVSAYQQTLRINPKLLKEWEYSGQRKITLRAESEVELLELQSKARREGLITNVIIDAGRTQVAPGTKTVLAIGPGPSELIDTLTGHLKLY